MNDASLPSLDAPWSKGAIHELMISLKVLR